MPDIEASVFFSCLGLLLDIVGAFLIWRYGIPESVSRTGSVNLILEQSDDSEIAKAKRYDKASSIGFAILITGFVLQFVGQLL